MVCFSIDELYKEGSSKTCQQKTVIGKSTNSFINTGTDGKAGCQQRRHRTHRTNLIRIFLMERSRQKNLTISSIYHPRILVHRPLKRMNTTINAKCNQQGRKMTTTFAFKKYSLLCLMMMLYVPLDRTYHVQAFTSSAPGAFPPGNGRMRGKEKENCVGTYETLSSRLFVSSLSYPPSNEHSLSTDTRSTPIEYGFDQETHLLQMGDAIPLDLLFDWSSKGNEFSHSLYTALAEGLSEFHLSMLRRSRSGERHQFVTGHHPVHISVQENPTKRWLNRRKTGSRTAETDIYVNGTLSSRSLASFDRFHWLDEAERQHHQEMNGMLSVELLAEIHLERPGYLQILHASGAGSRAAMREQHDNRSSIWKLRAMKLLRRLQQEKNFFSRAAVTADTAMKYYNSITNNDRLWVTGFSLGGKEGRVSAVDCEQCYIQPLNKEARRSMVWPNEVQQVPFNLLGKENRSVEETKKDLQEKYQDALLVCDGFLVPTKDRGGLYVVRNPGHEDTESTVCLTGPQDADDARDHRWFYHRAVWVDLTGDGRQSILTARCKVSTALNGDGNGSNFVTSGVTKTGQLIWLECPKPAKFDPVSGTPLEEDGSVFDPFDERHMPWKTRVLANGPDAMFAVADLDVDDDTVEVISSQFFQKKVRLHSIQKGEQPEVVFERSIDEHCGQAFGSILADLDVDNNTSEDILRDRGMRAVVNSGSTVECLSPGDTFSHLLVTSHEGAYKNGENSMEEVEDDSSHQGEAQKGSSSTSSESTSVTDGGSLFAYRVPRGKKAWRTEPWTRTVVASGFKVSGKLNNMINPGAPGFVYTFHAKKEDAVNRTKRPMIAVAGDCAESAYVFRPENVDDVSQNKDPSTKYKLMVEFKCQATVGSIGIGYDDFSATDQESGYAKLYIPCYEKDKVLVFGLGSGKAETSGW